MRTKWSVIRQDSLTALQPDGSWGSRSTAREYASKARALAVAARASRKLDGRLVTIQEAWSTLMAAE